MFLGITCITNVEDFIPQLRDPHHRISPALLAHMQRNIRARIADCPLPPPNLLISDMLQELNAIANNKNGALTTLLSLFCGMPLSDEAQWYKKEFDALKHSDPSWEPRHENLCDFFLVRLKMLTRTA